MVCRPRTYEAPSEDLLEALTVLTRYVYSLEDTGDPGMPLKPAQSSAFQWLPATPQPPAAPALVGFPKAHSMSILFLIPRFLFVQIFPLIPIPFSCFLLFPILGSSYSSGEQEIP